MAKGILETAGDYWAEYFGLNRNAKTSKKRKKLREAAKMKRQMKYGKKLGAKAVENRRRRTKQMERIAKGSD